MASIKIYNKEQTDTLLLSKADVTDLPSASELVPDTTGASSGDVLTFDGSDIVWAAGGGGGGPSTRAEYLAAVKSRIIQSYLYVSPGEIAYINDNGTLSHISQGTSATITVYGKSVTIAPANIGTSSIDAGTLTFGEITITLDGSTFDMGYINITMD